MKNLFKVILIAAFVSFAANANADTSFKIKQGLEDTVYSKKHYIVAITDPSNTAVINGTQVRVHKTGTFGTALELKEGLNTISISVFDKNSVKEEYYNVVYVNGPAPKRLPQPTEAEILKQIDDNTLKPCLFHIKTLPSAYLQYSDGNDRLGGSKIGFINEGIVLKVVGKIRELYKVQLSENRYAYLPQEYATATEEVAKKSLTGSWSVVNAGSSDAVRISLDSQKAFSAFTTIDPNTLCVDIYGAECNSNWMTQRQGLEIIDYVDFQQIESDVFRAIIKLKGSKQWGYDIKYERNTLAIKVKHAPELTLAGMVIGLDAGHGGSATGAVSITGLKEKELNLEMVYTLKRLFEKKGATVVLSRPDDRDMTMPERKQIFKEANPDMIISIHCNASGSPVDPIGTSTYYKKLSDRALAESILNRLLDLGMPNFGLVGNFNFSLAAITHCPSVLVETLFMSSMPDEEMLADASFRLKMMEKVVSGVEDYLRAIKTEEKAKKKK